MKFVLGMVCVTMKKWTAAEWSLFSIAFIYVIGVAVMAVSNR